MSLSTPVAFLIFNRPDLTQIVFNAIRQAKPSMLLVVADGARPNCLSEAENCSKARSVIEQVDWNCQVLTNFSQINLGCKRRISTGLDWIFNTVEEAIILEDDCLPHRSFFQFCQELLDYYRNDTRIMAISGDNFQFGRRRTKDSYYVSRYNHCWGWASWRRAWQHYDVEMKLWKTIRDGNWLADLLGDRATIDRWTELFDQVASDRIDTWDFQWTFACWMQHGLTILPNVNLVSNLGFSASGTHTTKPSPYMNLSTEEIQFPLQHPAFLIRDAQADERTQQSIYCERRSARIRNQLKRVLEKFV